MAKATPLSVALEEDEIVIRLGIERLKELTEGFAPFEHTVTVADPVGWAQAVVECLTSADEESGLTPLVRELFEAAIDEASTTGGPWLEVEE